MWFSVTFPSNILLTTPNTLRMIICAESFPRRESGSAQAAMLRRKLAE
jgi:hypothetical protein